MWICLNNSFLSIVHKNCEPDQVLVRARRPNDIERIFPDAKVDRDINADYLYRATISRLDVALAIAHEVNNIEYPNFKESIEDELLHDAYIDVWCTMAALQSPPPYSGIKKRRMK
jgi:hypothetical protein